jgi:hypothetical protein
MPEHQTPMRGGLMWIDRHAFKKNGKNFKDCSKEQQIAMVDEIAYPNKAAKEVAQGVAFFLKQLGRKPIYRGQLLQLNDCHGGDWAEWPNHLRVREFPGFFHEYGE